MKNLKDVTVEELKAIYKKHGLKPASNHGNVIAGCCCGLGVLCVDAGTPVSGDNHFDYKGILSAGGFEINEDLSGDDIFAFTSGFDRGFDNRNLSNFYKNFQTVHEHAYKLGQKMRKALDAGEFA